MKSFSTRLEALERARWERLTPLERAYELIERSAPPEQWPDDVLDAYCEAHCTHLECLSDEQLETLIACPEGELDACYYAMTGREPPSEQADSVYYRRRQR